MNRIMIFTLLAGCTALVAGPVETAAENRALEKEVREMEKRWIEQSTANQLLRREKRNCEKVIEQQRAVIRKIEQEKQEVSK